MELNGDSESSLSSETSESDSSLSTTSASASEMNEIATDRLTEIESNASSENSSLPSMSSSSSSPSTTLRQRTTTTTKTTTAKKKKTRDSGRSDGGTSPRRKSTAPVPPPMRERPPPFEVPMTPYRENLLHNRFEGSSRVRPAFLRTIELAVRATFAVALACFFALSIHLVVRNDDGTTSAVFVGPYLAVASAVLACDGSIGRLLRSSWWITSGAIVGALAVSIWLPVLNGIVEVVDNGRRWSVFIGLTLFFVVIVVWTLAWVPVLNMVAQRIALVVGTIGMLNNYVYALLDAQARELDTGVFELHPLGITGPLIASSWLTLLTLVLGIVCGFVAMLLPWPRSAVRDVREGVCASVESVQAMLTMVFLAYTGSSQDIINDLALRVKLLLAGERQHIQDMMMTLGDRSYEVPFSIIRGYKSYFELMTRVTYSIEAGQRSFERFNLQSSVLRDSFASHLTRSLFAWLDEANDVLYGCARRVNGHTDARASGTTKIRELLDDLLASIEGARRAVFYSDEYDRDSFDYSHEEAECFNLFIISVVGLTATLEDVDRLDFAERWSFSRIFERVVLNVKLSWGLLSTKVGLTGSIAPQRLQFATQASVAIAISSLSVVIPSLADVFSGGSRTIGLWAPLSTAFVILPVVGLALQQGLVRLVASLLGCLYGSFAMLAVVARKDRRLAAAAAATLSPTPAFSSTSSLSSLNTTVTSTVVGALSRDPGEIGDLILLVLLLLFAIFVSSLVRSNQVYGQGGATAAITAAIILLEGNANPDVDLTDFTFDQLRQALFGILVAIVVTAVPWTTKTFPTILRERIIQTMGVFRRLFVVPFAMHLEQAFDQVGPRSSDESGGATKSAVEILREEGPRLISSSPEFLATVRGARAILSAQEFVVKLLESEPRFHRPPTPVESYRRMVAAEGHILRSLMWMWFVSSYAVKPFKEIYHNVPSHIDPEGSPSLIISHLRDLLEELGREVLSTFDETIQTLLRLDRNAERPDNSCALRVHQVFMLEATVDGIVSQALVVMERMRVEHKSKESTYSFLSIVTSSALVFSLRELQAGLSKLLAATVETHNINVLSRSPLGENLTRL